MSSTVDFINALQASGLGVQRMEAVTRCQTQAMAYVWGYQDAGGAERDTGVSIEFGNAYGMHALEYETQQRGDRRMIQDAYARWVENGSID